jgi:hypothetical protein
MHKGYSPNKGAMHKLFLNLYEFAPSPLAAIIAGISRQICDGMTSL